MTVENDLVLVYYEDKPAVFARVEAIAPDHKPGWYQVRLLLLQLPLQLVTWILRDAYIDGDTFTMNGKRMRLEKVEVPALPPGDADGAPPEEDPAEPKPPRDAKVISLADLKKS